ncbi:hypothetical protein H6A66_11895 [Bacteroides caecigallinarum]|uniref:hypothetical protein n=1 Tax=Bacteroides caecigallinarum TaxID=1411144 RepID=UPI00195EBEA5|nr:hypothetical protein [Bacteroides caecigallinarum]MBM6865867.1 hypothetical protein [Bacteroides caecigallinarum]
MSDKIDTHAKADIITDLREQQLEREKNLSILRVTNTTIILVPRKKQNEKYAEDYRRKKMGLNY